MKEQNGSSYQASEFLKAMGLAEAKVGKTCALVAWTLGLMPGQKFGGVIDKPENLHVLSLDAAAIRGAIGFLKMLNAPKEAFNFKVYNLEDDVRRVSCGTEEWDYSLYNNVLTTVRKITDRCKGGSPVIIVSSLTTLALALERAIAGPPNEAKRGAGMDQAKWSDFARQLNEIRNVLQQDSWHCIWEGHIYKPPATGQNKNADDAPRETLQVAGKAGYNFPNNVEQVFRIRRMFGQSIEGNSKIDQVYLDTRPSMEFIAGGRLFTEALDAKEYDLTLATYKLGLTVGRWGAKKKEKAA